MKILIIFLVLVNCYSLELSKKQIKILNLCYKIGKVHNLENTLMGICYIESTLGLYKVGVNDYGIVKKEY